MMSAFLLCSRGHVFIAVCSKMSKVALILIGRVSV